MLLYCVEPLPFNEAAASVNAWRTAQAGISTKNRVPIPVQPCRLRCCDQEPCAIFVLVDRRMNNLPHMRYHQHNTQTTRIERTQERQSLTWRLCGCATPSKVIRGHPTHTNLSILLSSSSAVVSFPSPINLRSASTVFLPSSLNCRH